MKLLFVSLLAALLLVGCQHASLQPLPDVQAMPLLLPGDFSRNLQLQQKVVGQYAGKRHEMLCVLEVHADTLSLAALSPQGMTLFGLHYDGETLQQTRSRWLPEQLQATQVLNDIQLALWPAEAVIARLPKELRLLHSEFERKLFEGERLRTTITYAQGKPLEKGGEFQLVNHLYNYALRVQTLEATPL